MSFIQLWNWSQLHCITATLDFCILFHLTNSLPIYLIKVAIWFWYEGFYFLFHAKYVFSTFDMGLLFTPTVSLVNRLSTCTYVCMQVAVYRCVPCGDWTDSGTQRQMHTTLRPNALSVICFSGTDHGIRTREPRGKLQESLTWDLKREACHYLAWHLALLG